MSILRSVSRCLKRLSRPATSPYFSTNGSDLSDNFSNTEMGDKQKRIVWMDMEMTGLDIETSKVLEIACLITDENLNIVSDEFHVILNQPDSELNRMDEWCTKHHKESGLTEASKKSTKNESNADEELLFFMMKYIPKGKCPMAGNSVYMDRLFLRKYMPISNDYMHYRIIDVSSIKEVVKRWKPEIYKGAPEKLFNHRAVDDIKESIKELEYYRKYVFNANSN